MPTTLWSGFMIKGERRAAKEVSKTSELSGELGVVGMLSGEGRSRGG